MLQLSQNLSTLQLDVPASDRSPRPKPQLSAGDYERVIIGYLVDKLICTEFKRCVGRDASYYTRAATAKFYVSYMAASKEQVHHFDDEDRDLLIWKRCMIKRHHMTDTFSFYQPITKQAILDPQRVKKAFSLAQSFSNAVKYLKDVQEDIVGLELEEEDKPWWYLIRECPSAKDLPALHKEMIQSVCTLIAHLFDSVLDDPSKRHTMQTIYSRLPVSLMVYSVKVMSPAPFVDKFIKLFLWAPTNDVPSLVQYMASLLCKQSESVNLKRRMDPLMSSEFKNLTRDIIDNTSGLFSTQTDQQLTKLIIAHGYKHPERTELAYFRVCLRCHEKNQFVASLNDPLQKQFIIHALEGLPTLVREMTKFCDTSAVIKQYFACIGECLEIMKKYDEVQKTDQGFNRDFVSQADRHDMIQQMSNAWYRFVEHFYPFLRKLESLRNTEQAPQLWIDTFDFVFEHLMCMKSESVDAFEECVGPCVSVHKYIDHLDESEREQLKREVEAMIYYSERGTSDQLWPEMPIMDKLGQAFGSYMCQHCFD
ncbi:hypothetical protein EDD86DRAFT_249333 [Gorgonomyces haynaldii]|nr:hypothetical protein EDD86DRAFT_249333 [Gorgonomyces haynaldii]